MTPISTEDALRDLLHRATADLVPPATEVAGRVAAGTPAGPVAIDGRAGRHGAAAGRRPPAGRRLRRSLAVAGAVTVAAAAAVALVAPGTGQEGRRPAPTVAAPSPTMALSGAQVVYRLASVSGAVPAPIGRYAVQIEQQQEQGSSYVKASVVDSLTGDVWTYQQGPGVPAVLPRAPHLLPTEAQTNAMPTDPVALRAALVSAYDSASPADGGSATPEPSDDTKAFVQAAQTLWNPLLDPPLRAALLRVIAATPGVQVAAHATDARGRAAVEVTLALPYLTESVYMDPTNGTVDEFSFVDTPPGAGAQQTSGSDVYLSLTRSDAAPTIDPLTKSAASPATSTPSADGAVAGSSQATAGGEVALQGATAGWIRSPSANISCELTDPGTGAAVTCQTTTPPTSAAATAEGITVCHGTQCVGNPPDDVITLAYGARTHLGAVFCSSASDGMTCVVGARGFRISSSGIVELDQPEG